MRKYKVVLMRQVLWRDLHPEIHRVGACNAEEAVAEAKDLVRWGNEEMGRDHIAGRGELREVHNSRGTRIWSHLINE